MSVCVRGKRSSRHRATLPRNARPPRRALAPPPRIMRRGQTVFIAIESRVPRSKRNFTCMHAYIRYVTDTLIASHTLHASDNKFTPHIQHFQVRWCLVSGYLSAINPQAIIGRLQIGNVVNPTTSNSAVVMYGMYA